MTSEISLNNINNSGSPEKTNKILNPDLLWDNIKRNKVMIIIAGIVMFFAGPFIAILAYVSTENISYSYYYPYKSFYHYLSESILPVVFILMIAVSIIFGLCLALSATGYIHDKRAAVFFNSIPIRKRTLFTTQVLGGIIYFIAPMIVIYLISIAFMPAYITFVMISKIFLTSAFVFLLIYSFAVMCANIAGTAFNTVVTVLYTAFFIAGIFWTFMLFVECFYRFTSTSALANDFGLFSLLPIAYFIGEIAVNWFEDFNFVLILLPIMLVLSAGFLFAGGFLNKISRTENAEKPFYFKFYQVKFKYVILAIVAVISGVGFYQGFGHSIFYLLLGMAVGGFIAFLVINFIIHKNIREVFSGIKQFAIFILAAGVILTFFSFDVFGIDKYIPKASDVKSIDISNIYISNYYVYNYSITKFIYRGNERDFTKTIRDSNIKKITDPEAIELINSVFKAAMKSKSLVDSFYETTEYSEGFSITGYEILYKLKSGFTANKQLPYTEFSDRSDREEYSKAVAALVDNRGFKEAYFAPVTDKEYMYNLINSPNVAYINTSISLYERYDYYDLKYDIDNPAVMTKMIEKLNEDILSDDFEMFGGGRYTVELFISISDGNKDAAKSRVLEEHRFTFNITDSYKNTIAYIQELRSK